MTVYQRYFRVTSGPLMEKAREIAAATTVARQAVLAFCQEIGADNALMLGAGDLCGFTFATTPDQKTWKQPNDFRAYMPRKNTEGGRAMLKRIEALPKIQPMSAALHAVGLHNNAPVLVKGRTGRCSSLTGSVELGVLFVGVPWRDVSDDRMAAYKRDAAAGNAWSMEMEHLQWQPTADMVEIKRWQVEKEIDELNERLRQTNSKRSEVPA